MLISSEVSKKGVTTLLYCWEEKEKDNHAPLRFLCGDAVRRETHPPRGKVGRQRWICLIFFNSARGWFKKIIKTLSPFLRQDIKEQICQTISSIFTHLLYVSLRSCLECFLQIWSDTPFHNKGCDSVLLSDKKRLLQGFNVSMFSHDKCENWSMKGFKKTLWKHVFHVFHFLLTGPWFTYDQHW